jgi:hypothetical protein
MLTAPCQVDKDTWGPIPRTYVRFADDGNIQPAEQDKPVPEAGDLGPGGSRFTHMAQMTGELLAAFRRLPAASLQLEDLWADPQRLAAAAASWAEQLPVTSADRCLGAAPGLFAGRPVVLTHGDFEPVNILTDGTTVTGLLDFEAVRLADPLFDPAWWAWSVSFSGPVMLESSWSAFLAGAGIDPAELGLSERVRTLQVLRMMEQLATRQPPRHRQHRHRPVARGTDLTSAHAATRPGLIVKTCGSRCLGRFRLGLLAGSFDEFPLMNVAPARTRATRWGALTARQRSCAASMSLNAMARPAARDPGPRVILVRCLTVAKVYSIGLVVRRCTQCSAG